MARTRVHLHALTEWITAAAREHPETLPAVLMARLGVSRATARKTLDRLVEAQWLVAEAGRGRARRHRPGLLRQVVQRYPLQGLDEHLPWVRDFRPHFDLAPHVARLAEHAFTELLNNAIDHSGGSMVTVSMRQTASHLQLLVSDNGRGLFDKAREAFDLVDPALVALELSKGKLTSDPARHAGRGLFFTAQAADVFDLQANDSAYQRRAWDGVHRMRPRDAARAGTSVFIGLALDTTRTLDAVLQQHSHDGRGVGFERTRVPLQLLAPAGTSLASRAQAKRAVQRLGQFRHAELDFSGIDDIGHAFADELFRVFARECPDVALSPQHMAPRVAAMVESVRGLAA